MDFIFNMDLIQAPGKQKPWLCKAGICRTFSISQAGKLALANASENLAGRVENRPGRVEFCIGYIGDYPVRASAKKF